MRTKTKLTIVTGQRLNELAWKRYHLAGSETFHPRKLKPLVIGSTIQRRARQTDLLMSQQPQILRTNKDLAIIIKQGLLRMNII